MKKKFFLISFFFCIIILVVIGKFFLKNDTKKSQGIIQEQKIERQVVPEKESKKDLSVSQKPSLKKKKFVSHECVSSNRANEEYEECKYENDPMFDFAMLSGSVDDYNVAFRDEFYSYKDYETVEEQLENPDEDVSDDLVVQFDNVIDYALGADFPEERRVEIRSAQKEMLYKKSVLDNLSEQGVITDQDYTSQLSTQYEESLKKVAEFTNDQEFELLYGIKKSDIINSFFELIDSSSVVETE